jgi:S-adenosylmethionine:diacylglycerol 3-amino-3-carboxypropyl transferase
MEEKVFPIQIIAIQPSKIKSKKYRVFLNNGRHYDFGSKNSQTYLDHKDVDKRRAYIARHYGNIYEKKLIDELKPSPSLFSTFLLWGQWSDLKKNIDYLNNEFREKKIIR